MIKILNNLKCFITHSKFYKLELRGRVLDHIKCSKCGREFTRDRYSTGPK